MVNEARRLFPEIEFIAGDMLSLPFDDGSLAGAVSFYSIIHFDDAQLARAFAEMRRVLAAESLLALAFHVGDEVVHREQWWDIPVVLDSRFLPTEHVSQLLSDADFGLVFTCEERPPYAPEVEYQSRRAYLVARPLLAVPGTSEKLPPFGLGYPRTDLRRELVEAVLRGDKIATAGLADQFAPNTFEPLPVAGDRWALLGFDDEPIGVVETTAVNVVRAADVDLEFARAEGEGFESVADWRAAHERFWSDRQITDDTPILCEYFRLVSEDWKSTTGRRTWRRPAGWDQLVVSDESVASVC